jgi:hypothetical protein
VASYYLSILGISIANLVLAVIAYAQRAKQIRGNALREQQVALAEARTSWRSDAYIASTTSWRSSARSAMSSALTRESRTSQ